MKAFRTLSVCMFLVFITLPTNSYAADVVVIIKKMKYQPQEVVVKKGGSVRWENREKRQYHNVWFEQLGEPETDYFFPGESYERRFNSVGEFPYRCGPHEEMSGLVRVVD